MNAGMILGYWILRTRAVKGDDFSDLIKKRKKKELISASICMPVFQKNWTMQLIQIL